MEFEKLILLSKKGNKRLIISLEFFQEELAEPTSECM